MKKKNKTARCYVASGWLTTHIGSERDLSSDGDCPERNCFNWSILTYLCVSVLPK